MSQYRRIAITANVLAVVLFDHSNGRAALLRYPLDLAPKSQRNTNVSVACVVEWPGPDVANPQDALKPAPTLTLVYRPSMLISINVVIRRLVKRSNRVQELDHVGRKLDRTPTRLCRNLLIFGHKERRRYLTRETAYSVQR